MRAPSGQRGSTAHLSGPESCPCRTPACCQALRWAPPRSARPTILEARARAQLPPPPATRLRGHKGLPSKAVRGVSGPRQGTGLALEWNRVCTEPTSSTHTTPHPAAHSRTPKSLPGYDPKLDGAKHQTSRTQPHSPKFSPDSAYKFTIVPSPNCP